MLGSNEIEDEGGFDLFDDDFFKDETTASDIDSENSLNANEISTEGVLGTRTMNAEQDAEGIDYMFVITSMLR